MRTRARRRDRREFTRAGCRGWLRRQRQKVPEHTHTLTHVPVPAQTRTSAHLTSSFLKQILCSQSGGAFGEVRLARLRACLAGSGMTARVSMCVCCVMGYLILASGILSHTHTHSHPCTSAQLCIMNLRSACGVRVQRLAQYAFA